MNKYVDCVCGHPKLAHCDGPNDPRCFFSCSCNQYDPAGHNPEIYNIVCPQCRLSWMVPNAEGRYYMCLNCTFILFDRQIPELLSKG